MKVKKIQKVNTKPTDGCLNADHSHFATASSPQICRHLLVITKMNRISLSLLAISHCFKIDTCALVKVENWNILYLLWGPGRSRNSWRNRQDVHPSSVNKVNRDERYVVLSCWCLLFTFRVMLFFWVMIFDFAAYVYLHFFAFITFVLEQLNMVF